MILGGSLRAHCLVTEELLRLEEAVQMLERAATLAPHARSSDRHASPRLGVTRYLRFTRFHDPDDLGHAVTALRDAIAAADGLPAQAEHLLRLGVILDASDEETGTDEHRGEAIDLYARAAAAESASPAFRITAARFAARAWWPPRHRPSR